MSEEGKSRGFVGGDDQQQQQQYGTFQGVPSYPQPQTVIGIPQPVPPPGVGSPYPSAPPYYAHGYQAVPVYAVAEVRPVRERHLPCCGIGIGWLFFISGFFLAAIPWYVGAIILLCVRSVDYREKPGLIACTVAAILAAIAVFLGLTKGTHDW
ncbi:60S ribosomal protein L18a-like protein [Telopea speciosissima]|uniref:60S ribosomal protein L18a-like protein n=1 Tax=Telopea speciosissima TaxID=54955 RepID=UPI001CC6B9DC|nr:60S ribosomal protein L18a-like protein [Telopea speciosissima]